MRFCSIFYMEEWNMNDKIMSFLEQYPVSVKQISRGRGSYIVQTEEGRKILKEFPLNFFMGWALSEKKVAFRVLPNSTSPRYLFPLCFVTTFSPLLQAKA